MKAFSYAEMKELQALPLEKKVSRAEQLISLELANAKIPSVACSFGKDSMVLLHLVLQQTKDVWQYHIERNIPRNPIYDKMKRNGCMTCTGFKGWRRQLAKTNLKLYNFISKEMGQTLLYDYGCKGDSGYEVV